MAAKYQLITELYRRTGVAVAKNPQAWQGFLSSACRNYKCRFDEQLLIYAQRPDAVAVAKLETWNRQFRRWVNKDSKGIAVFDSKGRRNTLKYYFDVSDTHEGYYGSRPVPIWQMDERYEQAVMERLSDRFGDVESTDLASALMETAKNAVEDNLQDYFSQLKDCTKDSFLEELDDFNIEVIYRRLAANSVAFMLISRCGLDANEFFDREDFADIVNFNTPATINAIGVATSDIAEMALREISQSIRNVQMAEKDQNRTFEQRTQALYDKGRQQPERSEYNEQNHLQQTGGLSYSRPNITDRARASAWQVRFDAQGLSGEEQASDLSQPADIGQAERASARGRADSTPEVGASDEAALSRAGRNRGTERESSDAVGRTDEQHPQPSGGSDTDRTDLQVSVAKDDEVRVNLPTVDEQIEMIAKAEDENASAFTISKEDIDSVLQKGSGVADGKYRIYRQFQKGEDRQKNIEFLKNEYGTGGGTYIFPDGFSGHSWHDSKGLAIDRNGTYTNHDLVLKWSQVEKRLRELIKDNRYLNPKEKDHYAVASREDKEAMFLEYSELLNSLDSGATTKITINNRRLNKADFEQTILIPMADDGLDKYRKEYNKMLLDKATGANSIVQDKYVTVSVCKKNIEEARNYFARVGADLIAHFNRLGSKCVELDAGDKLRIFHDFYRTGEETAFHFDITQTMRKGHDFKDFICPDTVEFESDYFRMGDRYGRVIFLREYAAYIKDSMVAELCELNRNMMLSVDIIPVPTDEAVREVENRLLGVETNITNWQRKQNQNNNFSAVIPYDLEQQRKESKEFLDDLTTRDQRMMFAVLTMVHTADSKEQLDNDTEALLTTARKHLCQLAVLKYQQMDGLNTALPFGVRKIDALRTLTTESLAVFIPFRVQEIYHENGVYYGQNVISKNMIIANRRQLLNGNSFILGVSGAGKSFTAKEEMTNIILTDPNADIIIIDPEREYSPLVKAMQGEVIHISATSENHINAMDMNSDYGDGANPVILKSEFILSLCEQLIGGTNLGAKQKSIIDRCTASVYRYYQQGNYMGTPPTLQDFREELLKQNEPEAQEIALAIELFTDGSLNTFAKHTNVDTHSRLICYDILDLGKQLQPIGMLVVLDSILNRITQNRAKGRNTFIFIDEIYLLFQHEYSANFLFTLWKRVRKYGAYCTGITQNVDDLLQSHTARTMLANSEFIIMLNQASTDRLELAKLLNISDLQMSYITNVGAGQGLLKVGSSLVPFVNKFPRNTELYKLMTTKFGEV